MLVTYAAAITVGIGQHRFGDGKPWSCLETGSRRNRSGTTVTVCVIANLMNGLGQTENQQDGVFRHLFSELGTAVSQAGLAAQ